MMSMSSFSSDPRGSVFRAAIWHMYLVFSPLVHLSPLSYLIVLTVETGQALFTFKTSI